MIDVEIYSLELTEEDNGRTIREEVPDFDARMADLDDLREQLEREEAAEALRLQGGPRKRIFSFGGRLGIKGFRKKAGDRSQ